LKGTGEVENEKLDSHEALGKISSLIGAKRFFSLEGRWP